MSEQPWSLEPLTLDAIEHVRRIRNLDENAGAFGTGKIGEEEHRNYMIAGKYKDYYLCKTRDVPAAVVGWIGVDGDDIRLAVDPDWQRRGIGQFMVEAILDLYPQAFAKVKLDNQASLRLFEKCGFVRKYWILEREEA